MLIAVIVLWAAGFAVILHLERLSPRVADPASGHVYRFSDSLHTVYLTDHERYLAWGSAGVPILATLALVLLALPRRRTVEHF